MTFGRNTKTSMTISLNALGIVGTILFWLGLIVCVVSVYLFIAVSNGISDGTISESGILDERTSILTFGHSDTILIGWKERLVFLLPVAAGIALVVAGAYARGRVPVFKESLKAINSEFDSRQSRADQNPGTAK
jgi:hypothetical protein